jgi:hypothetical protein
MSKWRVLYEFDDLGDFDGPEEIQKHLTDHYPRGCDYLSERPIAVEPMTDE